MLNTSSIRPVVSIQYRLVTDGDGRTHDDSKYRASIASRGKNCGKTCTRASNIPC